jgi:metallo-beta-lactamase family protein
MKLSFHGAAQDVTGSCFLLHIGRRRILVDCGLYQGGREIDEINAAPFGFDPAGIDTVLLTHAHLDHCGRLPLLHKHGFRGRIVTTDTTRELARLALMDAAWLQEEDARRSNGHRRRNRHNGKEHEPLYRVVDALRTMDYFDASARYGKTLDLGDGIEATFHDAGHILGSASIAVTASTETRARRRIVFSGDLGNEGRPLLGPPQPPPDADYVVMESTYGDRKHRDIGASKRELYEAIRDTLDRGGNVLIPTFAMQRAQELLVYIRDGIREGALPPHLPVFLDSPMAISATEIFRRHAEACEEKTAKMLQSGHDPFHLPNLKFLRESADSMALNRVNGGAVIMAGSGMCTGGRIRHHLKHNLWKRDASVVFIGFAAPGTPARAVIDGAKTVRMFGQDIQVKAHIYTINGFSAHADREELLKWHAATGKPKRTFLVHGDPDRGMGQLASKLRRSGNKVSMPQLGKVERLD